MAISTEAFTLTTTAQKLTNDNTGRDGITLYITNTSTTVDIYIGGADVTTANGFVIPARTTYESSNVLAIKLDAKEQLYGLVGSGTLAIRIMHQGD